MQIIKSCLLKDDNNSSLQYSSSMRRIILLLGGLVIYYSSFAQPLNGSKKFSHQDTLRGSIGPGRDWWDVKQYSIYVIPDYDSKTTSGWTDIQFAVTKTVRNQSMQIDLQQPLHLDSAFCEGKKIKGVRQDGNAWFLELPTPSPKASAKILTLRVYYSGKPVSARRPPWDGGWVWAKDKKGRPWMTVACQGLGASVWYPCKDHQSDEPDNGAVLQMLVPDTLVAVANGRKKDEKNMGNGKKLFTWEVKNPINNYNIIPYIGHYVNWSEKFDGEKGALDCNYWVLDYDLEKAREQFGRDVKPMLKAFEFWFGPYPFYEDGFKLIEAPHLGMEHQSAIAYGNDFKNGYRGNDLSKTGWGLKWDFIIVHESGHEWFGNNITTKDLADMWVHEGFTNYSETLFTDFNFGKEAGNAYCLGTRALIQNDIPIKGPYGVNQEGSGDMYYKGGNLVHTLRQLVNDDEKFRQILRGLNKTFYHQTVTSTQVENYISDKIGMDLSEVFFQYLSTTQIPVLEYKIDGNRVSYRWTDCVEGFNLPVKLQGVGLWVRPTQQWQETTLPEGGFTVDPNFYIKTKAS